MVVRFSSQQLRQASRQQGSRSVEMQEPIFKEPGGQKAGEQDPQRAGQFLKSSLLRVFSFLSLLPV